MTFREEKCIRAYLKVLVTLIFAFSKALKTATVRPGWV